MNNISLKLNNILENTPDIALKRRAAWIMQNLELHDNQRVLDVGCGDGFYLHILSSIGLKLKLFGCDIDKVALKYARLKIRNKNIILKEANLMKKTPFSSDYFDRIVMSEVVEHLPDDLKGLKEVYRILKPGGILCISVPCANYSFFWDPVNWILERFFNTHIKSGYWAGIWNQHLRLYKLQVLENVIKKAGFKVEKIEVQTFWSLLFNHNILNLGARILANNTKQKSYAQGADKFSSNQRRSLLISIFFLLSNSIDKLNVVIPIKGQGVSLVVRAIKPK